MDKKYKFLKIPDENGNFTICIKECNRFRRQSYYFEPMFRIDYDIDKIVRSDLLVEYEDAFKNGCVISNKDEFKEYCKKQFNEFRESVIIDPIAKYVFKKQEPVYTDEEICNLKFKM